MHCFSLCCFLNSMRVLRPDFGSRISSPVAASSGADESKCAAADTVIQPKEAGSAEPMRSGFSFHQSSGNGVLLEHSTAHSATVTSARNLSRTRDICKSRRGSGFGKLRPKKHWCFVPGLEHGSVLAIVPSSLPPCGKWDPVQPGANLSNGGQSPSERQPLPPCHCCGEIGRRGRKGAAITLQDKRKPSLGVL